MSNLSVNSITNAAGGNTATINGMTPTAQSLQGFRNRIINGDMRIDQRNAGASVTVNTGSQTFSVDRWYAQATSSAGVFTVQQSTTAPTGFKNSLVATVTTTDSSLAGTDLYLVSQRIEGFNVADLGFGSASAATVTLSFWVRSSVTGTFGGAITNGAVNRSYPFTYSISSANTWEQKTVTFTGDTTGTWATDNSSGMNIYFALGVGSTYSGTANAWGGTLYLSATGATNLMATNGATFYITGVQLEAGSVATPFERRPYGTELQLAQRYFYTTSGSGGYGFVFYSSAAATSEYILAQMQFPVPMRATPTLTISFGGVSGQLGRLTSTASFGATSTAVYGSSASNNMYAQVNLYGTSAYGIRGDYTVSAEL